jgi:hypothetical protein
MHFLRSPITWGLLGLGIWLNCGYNYRVMQVQGVDAITTPMLFQQALIGSIVLVAIVCGLALLRGEKFELSNESDSGKISSAALIIGGVLLFGFVFNFILNRDLLFITQGGRFAGDRGDEFRRAPEASNGPHVRSGVSYVEEMPRSPKPRRNRAASESRESDSRLRRVYQPPTNRLHRPPACADCL